jgi:pyruvate ferredoxin oxidoreductase beta subunit
MTELADFKGFKARELPGDEPVSAGHRSCVGCGEILVLRLATKAIGRDLIVASATGCMEIVTSTFPQSAWEVPWIHVAFENAAAVASGIDAGLKALRRKGKIASDRKPVILAIAGDGGTADIGLQALSGALERGQDFLYICTDNEAYMNTGIQRSSATPYGAMTTTSPAGKLSIGQVTWKKDVPAIAAAHNIPYVATACPTYYLDLMNKVKRGAMTPGPAYIHTFAPCPTGWRYPGELSIEVGRLAVQTGIFPLYEVINGSWKLNMDFAKRKPVSDYLKTQGRFKHLTKESIDEIQRRVDEQFLRIKMLQRYSAHLENAKYYSMEAQV